MLEQIFDLLREIPEDKGDLISIAKGRNEFPKTFKNIIKQAKWLSQK